MIYAFAQYPLRNTVIALTIFDFKAFNAPHNIKFSNWLVNVEGNFLVSVMDLRVNDGCFCYIFNFFYKVVSKGRRNIVLWHFHAINVKSLRKSGNVYVTSNLHSIPQGFCVTGYKVTSNSLCFCYKKKRLDFFIEGL